MPDDQPATVYVSITGLRMKSPWHALRFWWHAVPSMVQAQRTPGCLSASARRINGIQHTLTVWEDERAMRRFLYRGAHGRAIRAFQSIGTGKTFGYATDRIPDWSEVHGLWRAHGRNYGERRPGSVTAGT